MKRIIILFLTVISAFSAYSQTLKKGDDCFAAGDYACAIRNYSAVSEFAPDTVKMKAKIWLKTAQDCAEYIKSADQKFADKDYKVAKENYEKVLAKGFNPNDEHAKSRLEECNDFVAEASIQEGKKCFEEGKYVCAETKYKEALELVTSGDNKRIADDGLESAKSCVESIKIADEKFENKDYTTAKENYQHVLNSNPKDTYAKSRLEKCIDFLNPVTVSKNKLFFTPSGGSDSITVTNANTYSVGDLPSWCTIQKNENSFVITCGENSGIATRNGDFTVTAGNKKMTINVEQGVKETLSTSKQYIYFISSGGSESIDVKTTASDYQIALLPAWCKVARKYSGGFTLTCDVNTGRSRSDWFEINAGRQTVKIQIEQAKMRTRECFNCPITNDPWGLTLGYVGYSGYSQETFEDVSLNGLQLGLRFEPLFKYGFGLHTGLLIEAYAKIAGYDSNDDWDDDSDSNSAFEMSAVNIPLHVEYRLNLSKWFNVFAYGGVGLNAMTTSEFEDYAFSATSEYGGGFRISHVQFNIGRSSHLSDIKNMEYFEGLKTIPKITFSISYMF